MTRAVVLLLLPLLLSGCLFAHENDAVEDRPDTAVGVGATVIYPGQGNPVIPQGGRQPAGGSASASTSEPALIGGVAQDASAERKNRTVPIIGPLTTLIGYPVWIHGDPQGFRGVRRC